MKDVKILDQTDMEPSNAAFEPNPLWLTNEILTGTTQRICHLLNYWYFKGTILPCNHQDHFQRAPLHYAALTGKAEVVKILLTLPGINVNILDRFRMTPLNIATLQNHPQVVKELLKHPEINVNLVNMFHHTPLCFAAKIGSEEIVKALLAHPKTDITIPDMHAIVPATYARLNNHDNIADLINSRITLGASMERVLKFADAVKYGDLNTILFELQRDPSIAIIHAPDGYTAMDHAVGLEHPHIVKALERYSRLNLPSRPASCCDSWEDVPSSETDTSATLYEEPTGSSSKPKTEIVAGSKSILKAFLGSDSSDDIDH